MTSFSQCSSVAVQTHMHCYRHRHRHRYRHRHTHTHTHTHARTHARTHAHTHTHTHTHTHCSHTRRCVDTRTLTKISQLECLIGNDCTGVSHTAFVRNYTWVRGGCHGSQEWHSCGKSAKADHRCVSSQQCFQPSGRDRVPRDWCGVAICGYRTGQRHISIRLRGDIESRWCNHSARCEEDK